jgi:hypothetical protein
MAPSQLDGDIKEGWNWQQGHIATSVNWRKITPPTPKAKPEPKPGHLFGRMEAVGYKRDGIGRGGLNSVVIQTI